MLTITTIASSSLGNCYLVSDGVSNLLLECGVSIKRIREATGYQLNTISGCLVSHEHGDHAKAVKDLLKAGVDCYTSAGTFQALGIDHHRANIIKAGVQVKIGSFTVMPFVTIHDCAEPLGFLIASGSDKLAFITDSAYVPVRFKGLTHIMVECNYQLDILDTNVTSGKVNKGQRKRVIDTHFGLDTVLEFLSVNNLSCVSSIYLMHLSNGNSNAKQMKEAVQRATGIPTYICAE